MCNAEGNKNSKPLYYVKTNNFQFAIIFKQDQS